MTIIHVGRPLVNVYLSSPTTTQHHHKSRRLAVSSHSLLFPCILFMPTQWSKQENYLAVRLLYYQEGDTPNQSSVQLNPVTDEVVRGTWGTIQQKIFFPSFLQEAPVNCSGMSRDVHSLMWSSKHFLCQPQCPPPSKVPWRWSQTGCHDMWLAWTM